MLNQIFLAHQFWASPCGFESTNQLPTSQAAYGHEYWVLCSLQEMYTNQKKRKGGICRVDNRLLIMFPLQDSSSWQFGPFFYGMYTVILYIGG
jgi:hypothetical protein